jgi:hypothetical protein
MRSKVLGICLGLGLLIAPIALPNLGIAQVEAKTQTAQKFSAAQESVGRIKLDMSLAQVSKLLGQPRKKGPITVNNCAGGYNGSWQYQGLEIIFAADKADGSDGKVAVVTVTSARFQTGRGIRVGDRIGKVEKIYGQKFGAKQEGKRQLMLDDQSGCLLSFISDSRDRVKDIQLQCLLC